nr:hypothetical protein [Tanacetum cinerariifolium]
MVDGNCDSQQVTSGHQDCTTMGKVIDDEGAEKLDNKGNKYKVNIPTESKSTPIAKNNVSYVEAANKLVNLIDNKLINIPTDIDTLGNEFVIFDEELINDGRMNFVLDNGPWMVNNKPLVVQKWDMHMDIDNTEPDKLPLWVRFCNSPLEALTVKGINALASKIGKPLIIDAITTSMCTRNVGIIGYARVLIEVSAKKGDQKQDEFTEVTYKKKRYDYSNEEMEDVYSMEDGMVREINEKDSRGLDGCRIIVGWNSTFINMTCVCASKQAMLCITESTDNKLISFLTFVYASNSKMERRSLWKDINRHKVIPNGHPWAISGDFNVTLNPNEHSAGSSSITNGMLEFKDSINQVEVEDLSSAGLHFTWTKNLHKVKLGDYYGILKKLDRIMTSEDLLNKHPQAHAIFMPYLISDHNPALLIIPKGMRSKKRSFKFANYITDKKDFCKIVEDRWKFNVGGRVVLKKYLEAVKDEEKLLYQKCKIKWISYGDKNNSFFHKMLKGRSQRNKIQVIYDVDVQRYEGDQVSLQFVNHFKNFLGLNAHVSSIDTCEDLFTTKLSPYEASQMVKPVTDNEIKKAMFNIADNKTPGPDGFSANFFKAAWHIVGSDVCSLVKEFFSFGKLLGELNATIISLIPKITTPMLVTDFRPIACCNVVYKCISKVISEGIKGCLDKLINKNESAFIPGRLIHDNILLA